jgi:hypothetical protein
MNKSSKFLIVFAVALVFCGLLYYDFIVLAVPNELVSHNIGVGPKTGYYLTEGHHNICIGPRAGYELTTESYLFCLVSDNVEYQTEMSHKEWQAMHNVINRAIWERNIPIGLYALYETTTGTNSTCIGYGSNPNAGFIIIGDTNDYIGYKACENISGNERHHQ